MISTRERTLYKPHLTLVELNLTTVQYLEELLAQGLKFKLRFSDLLRHGELWHTLVALEDGGIVVLPGKFLGLIFRSRP